MRPMVDRSGERFGKLVVQYPTEERIGKNKRIGWVVLCDCGTAKVLDIHDLVSGNTVSCGCHRRQQCAKNQKVGQPKWTKHGHSRRGKVSPTYSSWSLMVQRCTNPGATHFKHYGGANPPVKVCDRWLSFENFLADMGERPLGTTLGRKRDVGNYEPGNVFWMDSILQEMTRTFKRRHMKDGKVVTKGTAA